MTHHISVSVIAPTAYLRDFVAQDPPTVHHVAAHRVLHQPEYRDFFRDQADGGATVIVDNGVFELGASLPAADLVKAAHLVNAVEIILPDVRGDGPNTVRAALEGAVQIRRLTDAFRLCAVVHAADDEQWKHTYDLLVSSELVGALALPASRKPAPEDQQCGTRWAATAYLAERGLVDDRLVYRLLGLGRTGHLELAEQRRHRWIASVDGAAPVILGAMGIAMVPGGPYAKPPTPPVDALGPIPADRFALIRQNIGVVRAAAGDPVKIPEATS